MATELEKLLQETLSDLDSLSQDKIHTLIQEALKTFTDLKNKSHSTDPKERDEAFKAAMSLKQSMQAQTEEISKKADIDPALFASLADNQEVFSAETWLELSSAKKELEEFRDQLGIKPKKTSHAVKKNKGAWIPG